MSVLLSVKLERTTCGKLFPEPVGSAARTSGSVSLKIPAIMSTFRGKLYEKCSKENNLLDDLVEYLEGLPLSS